MKNILRKNEKENEGDDWSDDDDDDDNEEEDIFEKGRRSRYRTSKVRKKWREMKMKTVIVFKTISFVSNKTCADVLSPHSHSLTRFNNFFSEE